METTNDNPVTTIWNIIGKIIHLHVVHICVLYFVERYVGHRCNAIFNNFAVSFIGGGIRGTLENYNRHVADLTDKFNHI